MLIYDVIKFAAGMVASSTTGVVVQTVIENLIPSTLDPKKLAMVRTGTYILASMVGAGAAKYTVETIESAVDPLIEHFSKKNEVKAELPASEVVTNATAE